ncbi:MAG: hypothetical protein K2J26_06465, partial [Ruminococcus sp.]|nr:hypothetical protein [Ruminococcus sp.]
GPLARQANIHMYNNVFDGQSSYCASVRANSYIFSEYNAYVNECKDPVLDAGSGGVFKSYNDARISLKKNAKYQGVDVSSRSEKVANNNKYSDFDTNSSLSYIPSGKYSLTEKTGEALYTALAAQFETDGGCMDNMKITTDAPVVEPTNPETPDVSVTLAGDVNCDNEVSVADATLLLQYIGNGDKYKLSEQGKANADVDGESGISAVDALTIQMYDAGVVKKLPVTK